MTDNIYHSNLHILYQNDFGFIGKCPCCKEIQFGIGNVISFMHQDGFFRLYQSFREIHKHVKEDFHHFPRREKIVIRTPADNLLLSLTEKEFHQVLELFSRADLKLRLLDPLEKAEKLN